MTNDSVIKEAASAILAELERQNEERHDGPYTSSEGALDGVIVDGVVNILEVARAAFAVFKKADAPTDDDRETLARALFIASDDFAFADRMAKAWDDPGPHGRARWYRYADAILAAGFRRSKVPERQTEPSDARVESAARRLFGATVDSMSRARELARIALTAKPLVECPHWEPGKITFRNGCTACAEQEGRTDRRRGYRATHQPDRHGLTFGWA